MAVPSFVAVGDTVSAAGSGLSVPEPAGATDGNLQILAVQTANEAITLSTAAGFVAVSGGVIGTGTAGAAGATRLTLFSRIRDSGGGASGDPALGDSGDHQMAFIVEVSGQAAADYLHLIVTTTQAATTAGSADGGTTTAAECLVMVFPSCGGPDVLGHAGTEFSAWANADLDGAALTERKDSTTDNGVGGAIGLATGELAVAGAFGASTFTTANSTTKASIVLAVTGASAGGGAVGGDDHASQAAMHVSPARPRVTVYSRAMAKLNGLYRPVGPMIVPAGATA